MKHLLITFFTFFVLHSFAQNQANTWYFGGKAGIQFTKDSVKVLNNSQMFGWGNVFSISDKKGNLLFYGNQCHIWNHKHQKVYTNTQNQFVYDIIVVPHPKHEHLFYIFKLHSTLHNPQINCEGVEKDTEEELNEMYEKQEVQKQLNAFERGLLESKHTRISYSIFNTQLNGGKGGIAKENIVLLENITQHFTVARHQNDKGFWLICHQLNNDKFLTFLIDEHGIQETPIISQTGRKFYSAKSIHYQGWGYQMMKISPDFSKICMTQYPNLYFYEFDNQTGKISNQVYLYWQKYAPVFAFEFSSNSQKFYFTYTYKTATLEGLAQIDLSQFEKTSIEKSLKAYDLPLTNYNKNLLDATLAPDGKIYFRHGLHPYLAVIHNPNSNIENCNFESKAIYLGDYKKTESFLPICTHLLFLDAKPSIELGKTFSFPIKFEIGSSQMNEKDLSKIQAIIDFMQENPQTNIQISGHTDNIGNATNNLKLSEARAKALADYLVSQKIRQDRITYKGFGDTKPLADNSTKEGQAKNRRIEFLIEQ